MLSACGGARPCAVGVAAGLQCHVMLVDLRVWEASRVVGERPRLEQRSQTRGCMFDLAHVVFKEKEPSFCMG